MMAFARILLITVAFCSFEHPSRADGGRMESAVRQEGEPWQRAARRSRGKMLEESAPGTPESLSRPLDQVTLDLEHLPEWRGTFAELRQAFVVARDERYYDDGRHDYKRRSSWMYPDDGCYVRASHVAFGLERARQERPGRVFAFGDLRMVTRYHPKRVVFWWYHVAAAYRLGSLVVVLDPSAFHDRPLLLEEWIQLITKKPQATRIALCDTHAYMAAQICRGGSPRQESSQASHQKAYLRWEFARLEALGFDADSTLRENFVWGPRETFPLPKF